MTQRAPVRLGVLISGTGTNLQAIIDAAGRGELRAEIRVVISNRAGVQGLERARRHGIPTASSSIAASPSREDFDRALVEALGEHAVELVVCAGFMRLLSPVMLAAFPDRVMNIHPLLLPAFAGVHAQKRRSITVSALPDAPSFSCAKASTTDRLSCRRWCQSCPATTRTF